MSEAPDDRVIEFSSDGAFDVDEDNNHNLILSFRRDTYFEPGQKIHIWSSFIAKQARMEILTKLLHHFSTMHKKGKCYKMGVSQIEKLIELENEKP